MEETLSTKYAYVAGLIDGEGCIHLEKSRTSYRARVSVGMTAPALPLLTEMHKGPRVPALIVEAV